MFPNLLTQERRNIMKYLRSLILALAILAMSVTPALADRPPFVFPSGCCYYNGTVVRTVVPPAATPNDGRDNFYAVMGGVADQKGVVAVAPGDTNYHGGDWAFYSVTWNVS